MKNLAIARAAILFCGTFFLGSAHAQTLAGTNLPGTSQYFSLPISAGTTNLALSVAGSATTFSHLLLKTGIPPTDTDYDFIAASDGHANAINLELPELSVTNYVLRVRTPTNSLAHSFTVIVATNVSDLRTARPATKPLVFSSQGSLGSGVWNYFRVDIPTNVSGWRIILTSTNAGPDLYVQRDQTPTTSVWLKRSQGQTNDVIAFAPNELSPGAYFIGVYQPAGGGTYTLRTDLISFTALAWDPGASDLGTQVYTNQGTNGGDFYFKITTQNTALNAWRTALNVLAGEANIYLAKGAPPSTASNLFKSERLGSDGFVIGSSSFAAGEDWYYMVHAEPGSQWTLVSGEPFVTDLGSVSSDSSSGSGNVTVGAEGMRFFKTTVPVNTVGWRLWLNGSTNSILVKKGSAPIPGGSDLSQAGQMLVVPPYLVGGQLFFVGVAGAPGTLINLDSRQQSYSDIPFVTNANLSITGYGYSTFRVQVPSNQVAWQVSVVVSNGNPNIAVRRNLVPNESNNDAYSEVAGNVTDSILLVPPTLSDGTFYVTVYGASNYSCVLQSGNPEVTDINFVSATTNTDTNRVGWRLFKVSDISQQLGALGWDLFLTNFSPGTRIAMRRNAAPGIWNYRNPTQGTLGSYDFLSMADFLQRPGHQADVWYVGVYNPTNPLGNFTLITRELSASSVTFDSGSATRVSVPSGKWQFFRVDVPPNVLGWDVRLTNVVAGSPQLVVRREALPISLVNIGFPNPVTSTNWPTGNQWAAASDWTGRNLSSDGSINESGRILTMGYGRPLETGTYYIGIINPATSTNDMSYTISSRGIGDGLAIPVQDLGYLQNVTNAALAARDLAVYRVSIPSNTPSWRVRLALTAGDALLAVGKDHVPNITAPNAGSVTNVATAGKKMLKAGNEHFVQLPPAGGTNILAGTYYMVVASEGAASPTNSTQIGSGMAGYVLQSLGSMPEMDLGLLDATDLVYAGQLEGGDSAAFHFHNYPFPTTLGFELSLSDRVGNPLMVSRGDVDIADPGADGTGVPADVYGNEGGQGNFLEASPGIITVSGPFETETIMVKARSSVAGVYPDAAYKLRVRRLFADPLAFDAGVTQVTAQTNIYQYFRIDVPSGALGWDVRITNVTGNAKLIICHEALPLDLVTPGWNPGRDDFWPFGAMWIAGSDWTGRSFSSDGATSEDGHILAMGMGRPLEIGTYYVGVKNLNSPSPISYTIVSRGIGDGLALPVVDVPFTGGAVTNSSLAPREAAYYSVVVPTNAASWQAKLNRTAGEALLVTLSNSVPSVLSGQSGALGKLMQKEGNEHYVLLPANGQPFLKPGTNFFAVVSEGIVATNTPTRIGSGSSSYVFESRGELKPVDLGTIDNSGVSATNALEGGEVRAYQFTVPAGTVSLEARLQNVTGNPAMVLRVGALFPNPGAASPVSGAGSVSADLYGNEGGQSIVATTGGANLSLITMANPSNTTYTIIVKARGSGTSYPNATYTLSVRALNYMTVDFDGGSATVANQPANNWQYFRVDVPPNALGWDVRITNVISGAPRLVVRRDLLPNSLTTTPWGLPGNTTNWPSTNQWAAGADWTRRTMTSDNSTNEDGRILAMGMGQPLEPGTYYVGVINSSGTNSMSYTLVSRGIGDGLSIPVTDLPYTGNVTNLDLPPREAAYYRVAVPANSPGWKLKLAPTSGEAMLLVLKDHIPNVDTGRQPSTTSGKFMQKAGNEHYTILSSTGQSNIAPGIYYIAVVGEGLNPGSATQIGTGSSDFVLTSFGDAPVANLGTANLTDTVVTNSLEGGESRLYQFAVSQTAQAIEVRLENRVGNPVLVLSSNTLPDPGGVLTGPKDTYGNDGGVVPMDVNSNIITIPNPTPGKYTIAIKARASGTAYPDASYVLRVRELPVAELNFTAEFNTNGLSNTDSRLLLDNQRAFYKVVVPANVWNQPVIGWQFDLSQLSGNAGIRVRKDFLPSDSVAGVPFTPNAAIIAPPFLTNGTWYVEVRGTNSTSYTLISSSLKLQRSAWVMPETGETNSAPGVSPPFFADTGVDTNGLPLPGDQGIDLQQGRYHYYAVIVPTNNAGLLRIQLDAISANSDLYMRLNQVPTYTHRTNGIAGTTLDRSVTSGTITEYANWVPLNGKSETMLTPGTWYLAVRAVTNANARYRLRLSTGNIQDLALDGGSLTNQIVAGGDWTYYRVQIPSQPSPNWQITFSQQAGDVVMHVRDTVPPGNGATTTAADYKDWGSDQKNNGPYASYDSPGAYTFTVPPIRPGTTYYLGFRGKSDSTFSVSSSVSGVTNLPLPTIEFYGGSVTNSLPAGGMVAYRILTPNDALRWRSTSTHSNSVQVFIENGTLPTRTSADDFHSTIANSTIDHFLTNYPWLPNQTFYLVATNTSATAQTFNFNMNGSSALADDDGDGLPDAWEIQYFGTLAFAPGADSDQDGVSNMSEYLEGTNPANKNSFRPRLTILSTNGIVMVDPVASNYTMGASVTLTATPSLGYNFVDWRGTSLSGSQNPLIISMSTNITVIPRFRVPADDFDQRIALSGFFGTSAGLQNAGATKESGEPNHAGNSGGKSLWWTWTAPSSGVVTFNTSGTDFRNALAIYAGQTVSNLTAIATNLAGVGSNSSQVTFNATVGSAYQIAVDGFNGTTGLVVLSFSLPNAFLLSTPSRQPDGSFQFMLNSAPGQVLNIEASTNLVDWVTLYTGTNATGTIQFSDPAASSFARRFYRAVAP